MLIKLFAWLWIIMGIISIIKPQFLQKRLQKKATKKLKKILFLITLCVAVALILASFKVAGLLPKIIMLIGIVGIFKAFFFLKSKSADKIIEWTAKQPLNFFRAGGAIYVIIGVIILNFS